MRDNKSKDKTTKGLDRFIKNFPIWCIIFTILFMILIAICSEGIELAKPNYQNTKIFTEIYEIPLKLFLVLLTIWGILVAYSTYVQTKDQYILLNKAWISTDMKFHLLPNTENKNILEKPALLFEIENIGNTPATELEVDINVIPSNLFNFDEKNKVPKILLPKTAQTIEIILGNSTPEYLDICKKRPRIEINIEIRYSTFDGHDFKFAESYKFEYPDSPYVIHSELFERDKTGEYIKIS